MCLEAANLTNLFCPELTTDSRKWSPLDISPWFLTSDSNNCCLKQCPLMYRIWTNICFTKYFLCVLSLAEYNCLANPKRPSGTQTVPGPKISENTRGQIPQICPKSIPGQTPRSLTPWQMLAKLFCTILGSPCIALPIIGKSRMAKMML